ncbi:MAG: hypothetical protein ABIN80_22165 [Dyadobacter sp.]|uniref:hypothetical protein n=1 Tax=Dyadobacter sp. TaxID=1914288 RepID=UPI003267DE40
MKPVSPVVSSTLILTNKAAKGGKGGRRCGSIAAIMAGTKAETIIEVLRRIPESLRKKVSEITLDMAGSMTMIANVVSLRLPASQNVFTCKD